MKKNEIFKLTEELLASNRFPEALELMKKNPEFFSQQDQVQDLSKRFKNNKGTDGEQKLNKNRIMCSILKMCSPESENNLKSGNSKAMGKTEFLLKARQVPYLPITKIQAAAALAVRGFCETPDGYGILQLIQNILPSREKELEMAISLLQDELEKLRKKKK